MSTLSNAAIAEIHQLQRQAERIISTPGITRGDAKRADVLIARISSIRATGKSSDELMQIVATKQAEELGVEAPEFRKAPTAEQRLFKRFLTGSPDSEIEKEARATTFTVGTSALGYSSGSTGGYLVPQQYMGDVREGMALADPLLDASIVTLVQEPDYSLRPMSIPGWDLSSAAAVQVGEISQESPSNIPTLSTELLNKFGYRVAFDMSTEFEEDASTAYGDPVAALMRANGIAIARGVGADLVNGDGATAPQGIVTGAHDSGVTTASLGSVSHDDLSAVFYSVNPIYRNAPKCAWLVNDAVHKQLANAKDGNQRPLFQSKEGVLQVFDKPVHICPSLPAYNASLGTQKPGSFAVFGDLSAYVVHSSSVLTRRLTQVPGLVEYSKVRVHSLIMVDAIVNDPTAGALPAIVSARLHA